MMLTLRILTLCLLILRGVLTTALILPWCSRPRQQRLIREWSRSLLRSLGLTVSLHGTWPDTPGPFLLTSNHVSWMDIFVIHSIHPVRFVSKSEVRQWPVFGWLAAKTGTLFLTRESRRQTMEIGVSMINALKQGDDLGLFPESTTSLGLTLLPFKTSLFQAPIDCAATLLPVALKYQIPPGAIESAYPFIGEMTFMESLIKVLQGPPTQVSLALGPPYPVNTLSTERRSLALQLQHITQSLLDSI
ncbi:MAG: 1-acyl-sn-glycerol-3-phosphate acyltransferase [Ferrovum sp.]|nr:1-acyl-sn-glycerol-3-phosphate acyltransferase [Ferrovum sp.]